MSGDREATSRSPELGPWPLVGRDEELGRLLAALEDPERGGVLLGGPAGVGKTRLAREVADRAVARGMFTETVRATRSASGIPLGALGPLLADLGVEPTASGAAFGAVLAALGDRGRDSRLLLVVDDAHLLDDASSTLLAQLCASGRCAAILTVRRGEPGTSALVELWKDERVERVDLGPLSEADLGLLVAAALPGPVDGVTRRSLVTTAAGNVLYLRELLRGALSTGALRQEGGLWRLEGSLVRTPRLQDLIARRVADLPRPTLECLELVALGEPLGLRTLSTLVPPGTVEALDPHGVLETVSGPAGPQLRLSHPLFGDVIRAHLSPGRRARLCGTLAAAVAEAGPSSPAERLAVALWRLEAGQAGPTDDTLWAAREALRRDDPELAARLARVAWDEGGPVEAAVLLADALDRCGRLDDVRRVMTEATPRAADDTERTAVAVRLASALFLSADTAPEADQVLSQAAARITDPDCRRALDAQRGDHFLRTGNVARTIEFDRPLLRGPRGTAYAQASRDLGIALALAGRAAEARAHAEAALSVRRDLADPEDAAAVATYVVARALAQLESGDLTAAGADTELAYGVALEHANPDGQAWLASVLGLVRTVQGRLETAERLFREAAHVFRHRGHPGERWALGGIALAAGQAGDAERARGAVEELDAVAPSAVRLIDVHIGRGRAWAAVAVGELGRATQILDEAAELALSWGQLAAAAAALHDLLRLDLGAGVPGRLAELGDRVDGRLMTARLAHAEAVDGGDPDAARVASHGFEGCGALLLAAECCVLEESLATRRGLARRAQAASARAARLVAGCEGARTPGLRRPGGPAPLTAREREIATLAAQGCSSREIAERLFVSVRTVDNHLQRVYVKLGITRRSELASALAGG